MPIYTDIADELYGPGRGTVPGGVKCYTARSGPITPDPGADQPPGPGAAGGPLLPPWRSPALRWWTTRTKKYVSAVAGEVRAAARRGAGAGGGGGQPQGHCGRAGPAKRGGVLVTRGWRPKTKRRAWACARWPA